MEKPYGFWLHALDDSIALWKTKDEAEIVGILNNLRRELVNNQITERNLRQIEEDKESWNEG